MFTESIVFYALCQTTSFLCPQRNFGRHIHLRNLLTHTLLFWHFLENQNFELKNTLELIRTMFSGNTWLFAEKNDEEYLKY